MADRSWSDPSNTRRDPTDNDGALGVSDPEGAPGNFLWTFPGLVTYLRSFFMQSPGTMGTGNLYVSTADPDVTADGLIAPIGLLQPSMTELTGTWTPARGITDPARVYSNDASFIVNAPSGNGAWEFLCGASCEPSVDGSYLQLGQRETGKTQYAYLSLDSTIGQQIFAWGAASP